jgi:hypothetical protein
MFSRLAGWVPGSGVVFAVLVVVATALTSGSPTSDDPDPVWVAYYGDSGHRHKEEIAFVLIGLAGLCFLQFLGSLRGALARVEGEPARVSTAAAASGGVFIALALASHAVGTALSWSKTFYGADLAVDPNTARILAGASFSLFAMSLFAASAMALAVATVGFRMRALPRWLSLLSVVAALAGLLGILGLPSIVVLLWIAALSVYLVVRRV